MEGIPGLGTPAAFNLPEMSTFLPRAAVGSIAARQREKEGED